MGSSFLILPEKRNVKKCAGMQKSSVMLNKGLGIETLNGGHDLISSDRELPGPNFIELLKQNNQSMLS